ncbi:MAG: hypothetical protein ACFCD0_04340 [Gemmataceae bacterium]
MSSDSLREWNEVLDKLERSVEQAMAAVTEQQQAFDSLVQSWKGSESEGSPWLSGLEDYHQRVQGFAVITDKAGESVKEVDQVLAQEEESLRQWLAATDQARRNLRYWLDGADSSAVLESIDS